MYTYIYVRKVYWKFRGHTKPRTRGSSVRFSITNTQSRISRDVRGSLRAVACTSGQFSTSTRQKLTVQYQHSPNVDS